MSSVINTNYLSLVAQNNLNSSQSALGTAITRLSSGLRINSAKDDAAGEAIANRFTANVNGLTQAARNANDGISIAQTTEGSLDEINNNLQRVRELTVQAANGTNSSSDLESIQAEITQRMAEIDRVSAQTQFNGVKVLASDQSLSIQVGANDNETININLKQINSSTLGLSSLDVTKQVSSTSLTAITGNFKDAVAAKSAVTVDLTYTGATPAAASLVVGSDGALYAKSGTSLYAATFDGDANTVTFDSTGTAAATSITAVSGATTFVDGSGNLVKLSTAQAAKETDSGVSAPTFSVYQNGADGSLVVSDGTKTYSIGTNGNSIDLATGKVTLGTADATAVAVGATGFAEVTAGDVLTLAGTASSPAVTYNTTDAYSGLKGTNTLEKGKDGSFYVKNTSAGVDTYYSAKVSAGGTVALGDQTVVDPLSAIDKALQTVDSFRSDLGAIQNRFESTITNLNNTVNNLSDARSRIQDADYATEVSNMSRAQILQQAGTSVLAQANQVPQTVLSLLR